MTTAGTVKGSMPPDTGLRIGIAAVDSSGAVTVSVSGKVVDCGFLDPGGIVSGSPVALLRGDSSWLALGATASQPFQRQLLRATADANLALTTVSTAISGMSVTFDVAAATTYMATMVLDVDITTAAATTVVGQLVVDGVTISTPQVIFASVSSAARATVTATWTGSLAAGMHTMSGVANKTINVGVMAVRQLNSTLTVELEV